MKKIKRMPTFKQMALETAVRNPERYIGILTVLCGYENRVLDDSCLLEIVSRLYSTGEVTSEGVAVADPSAIERIKAAVVEVNKTRRADGGFPAGYPSRFWTYMRTLSELGLVYAQYNRKFELSEISRKLIAKKLDEQEVFSIQAMKYNRKSPYRNVSNDFNYFRFILEVLLYLRDKGSRLSYEQFIVSTLSHKGDIQEFIELISNEKFKDYQQVYNFLKKEYVVKTSFTTTMQDYPDVVRRVLIISGFITIRYLNKKFIEINENKLQYIRDLLAIKFVLRDSDKSDARKYFEKLNSFNDKYIDIAIKYRKEDRVDGKDYTNKIFNIISTYKINENKITESIVRIGAKKPAVIPEFQEIPDPLKLEFYIAILIALKYGKELTIRPNYKSDHIGKPYAHMPGIGDIEIYSSDIYWLVEVTLIRNRNQQFNMETTNVLRHLVSNKEFVKCSYRYLSFIAPVIHDDTKEFYDIALIMHSKKKQTISIKPYAIEEFMDITIKKENFVDMKKYADAIFSKYKSRLA